MEKISKIVILGSLFLVLMSCTSAIEQQTIIVYNDIDLMRESESVTVNKSQLNKDLQKNFNNLVIREASSNEIVPFQYIDKNENDDYEGFIFQPKISPNTSSKYIIERVINENDKSSFETISYARFVPERIDDYAWENDKVAFRTYGPAAEDLVVNGKKGGIISRGIDCWLKRVEYPIIDKWYKKYEDGTGDYHKDTGEGLDNYHVGVSLGCGGLGTWDGVKLFVSGNFRSHKSLENGAVRTSFELKYNPWNIDGKSISEVKNISLDKGSNLSKYEVNFSEDATDFVVGLPIQNENAQITFNKALGWFSVWSPHADSELGLGIVIPSKYILEQFEYHSEEKDKSHLFIKLKTVDKKLMYYTGFGWKKSEQFSSKEDWNNYLEAFSLKLNSPIQLTINESQ